LLISNRANAIREAAANVFGQNRDRYAATRLSLVSLLSILSSSLMSRGNESSAINRMLSRYLSNAKCPLSDLALFPFSLKFNRNGHLSLVDDFGIDAFKIIFGKDYHLVESAPNGTPVNTVENERTNHLEVSFGFVQQSVPTPGDAALLIGTMEDEDQVMNLNRHKKTEKHEADLLLLLVFRIS
jgi:hypothetical protein